MITTLLRYLKAFTYQQQLFLGFYIISARSDFKVSVWYSLLVLHMKPTGCNLGPVKSLAV